MEKLGVQSFIEYLKPFSDKELASPAEASRILLIIAELLIDHTVDLDLLKFLSRFLTQQTYDEIIEEKNIEHQCGYPLCNNSPKQQVRRLSSNSNGTTSAGLGESSTSTKFQIYNRKPSMILPNTYLSQYCCKEHYQASLFYRNQLSQEAIFARKDILRISPFPSDYGTTWYENGITCLEEVLAKHKELKKQGKSLSEVISMMNGLSVADESRSNETNELIKLIEDFEIVEKEGGLEGDGAPDESQYLDKDEMSTGVDGYYTTDTSFGGYVV